MYEASRKPDPARSAIGKDNHCSTSMRPRRHSSDGWGLPTVGSSLLWSSLYTALGPWPWKSLGGLWSSSLMQYLLWWDLGLKEGVGKKVGRGILEALTCPSLSTQLDNQKLVLQPHVPPVIVLENHGLHWVPKDKNLWVSRSLYLVLETHGGWASSVLGPAPRVVL